MRRLARRTTRVRAVLRQQLPRRLRRQLRHASRARHSMSPFRLRSGTSTTSRTTTATPCGLAVPGLRRPCDLSDDHRCDAKESARRQLRVHGGAALLDHPPRTRDPGILRVGLGTQRHVCRAAVSRMACATGGLRRGVWLLCADRALRGGRQRQRRAGHVVAGTSGRHHGLPRRGEEDQRRDDGVPRAPFEQEGPGSESRQPADPRRRRGLQRAEDRRRIWRRRTTCSRRCRTTAAPMCR